MFNTEDHPHLRHNPLIDEWVIVSPHRMKRPWKGQIEVVEDEVIARHDSNNPLCPGAIRSSGKVTSNYTSTYVFDNDFPALLQHTPEPQNENSDLFQCKKAEGTCRVMCFHPYSDLSLPLMKIEEIQCVICTWISEYVELSKAYPWVQIFENRGKMMGCSNPHPHCQIWGCTFLPNEPYKEDKCQREYSEKTGKNMLMEYIKNEQQVEKRIVAENVDWIVVVPYWAVWPFELLLVPKAPTKRMSDLTESQQLSLAHIMKVYLTKYDNLFKTSFPYSMGWHGAPTDRDGEHWQLHAHYYPPLLRSASVKKHLVGFEMLSGNMRDFTPEKAAETLRNLSDVHYKEDVLPACS